MPDLKYNIVEIDITDTEPVASGSDPFGTNAVQALKLNEIDEFEEDINTTADGLGRDSAAGYALSHAYFIREGTAGAEAFVTAARGFEDTEVWVREEYQLQESGGTAIAKIIGAESTGCRVRVATATAGGFKGDIVTVHTAASYAGANYRDEPGYSTSGT